MTCPRQHEELISREMICFGSGTLARWMLFESSPRGVTIRRNPGRSSNPREAKPDHVPTFSCCIDYFCSYFLIFSLMFPLSFECLAILAAFVGCVLSLLCYCFLKPLRNWLQLLPWSITFNETHDHKRQFFLFWCKVGGPELEIQLHQLYCHQS